MNAKHRHYVSCSSPSRAVARFTAPPRVAWWLEAIRGPHRPVWNATGAVGLTARCPDLDGLPRGVHTLTAPKRARITGAPAPTPPALTERRGRGRIPQETCVQPITPEIERLNWTSNAYLVRTAAGTLLVDSGSVTDGPRLSALLSSRQIDAVWITHHHLDHAGGAWLAARLGLPILCLETEAPYLTGAGWRSRGRVAPPVPRGALHVAQPGQLIFGHEIIALPGHTPGQAGLRLSHHLGVVAADAVLERQGKAYLPWKGLNHDHEQTRQSLCLLAGEVRGPIWPGHGQALSLHAVQKKAAQLRSRQQVRPA